MRVLHVRSYLLSSIAAVASALMGNPCHAALTISSSATSNVTCASGVCTATAANAVLNVGDLETMLASSSVKVVPGKVARNLDIAAAVTWASSNSLTLDAYRDITIDQPVSVAGPGGLTLLTHDGGQKGALLFAPTGDVTFLGVANNLSINGHAYTLVNNISSLASAIAANPHGYFALANSYEAARDRTYSHSPIRHLDGVFDGLGNTISNLKIKFSSSASKQNVGLFGAVGLHGSIQDVKLSNFNLSGAGDAYNVGALAGINDGHIAGCVASGDVNFSNGLSGGGLVGQNNAIISRSSAVMSVVVNGFAGGLVAINGGKVFASGASGTVDSEGGFSGGLVAENDGLVQYSHSSSTVSGGASGGLIGLNNALVLNSYATGPVQGEFTGAEVGGLVGLQIAALIDGSFSTGPVMGGEGDKTSVGGLVGYSEDGNGTIVNSYSESTVSAGNSSEAGGLVGNNSFPVASSYSTGTVKVMGDSWVGGFVGEDFSVTLNTYSYWDTTTSGRFRATGNRGNEPGITGLSTTQLQSKLPAGFNPKIWAESPSVNGGLPYLIANPPPQ